MPGGSKENAGIPNTLEEPDEQVQMMTSWRKTEREKSFVFEETWSKVFESNVITDIDGYRALSEC